MDKLKFINVGERDVVLKYNEQKYSIEYRKDEHAFILNGKKRGEIARFSDKISGIIEIDKEAHEHFIVVDLSKRNDIRFLHYEDNRFYNILILINDLPCNKINLLQSRLSENSFFVQSTEYGDLLYNINGESKTFFHVYDDKNLNSLIPKGHLLVSERLHSSHYYEIDDIITYGIDLDTFNITTNIKSDLQNRIIKLYTEKQVLEFLNSTNSAIIQGKKGDFTTEQVTIYFEIQKYLELLAEYLKMPEKIYIPESGGEINKDFINKLIKHD